MQTRDKMFPSPFARSWDCQSHHRTPAIERDARCGVRSMSDTHLPAPRTAHALTPPTPSSSPDSPTPSTSRRCSTSWATSCCSRASPGADSWGDDPGERDRSHRRPARGHPPGPDGLGPAHPRDAPVAARRVHRRPGQGRGARAAARRAARPDRPAADGRGLPQPRPRRPRCRPATSSVFGPGGQARVGGRAGAVRPHRERGSTSSATRP